MALLLRLRRLLFGRRPDAWVPGLGEGAWRTAYGECCDALLAFDRVVSTMDDGAVLDRMRDLRAQLPPLLEVAERLAAIAERVSPYTPRRSGATVYVLGRTPADEVMDRLQGLRGALAGIADDAARIAVRLRENPAATDVGEVLASLGAGLAEARRHGWTPIGHQVEGASPAKPK